MGSKKQQSPRSGKKSEKKPDKKRSQKSGEKAGEKAGGKSATKAGKVSGKKLEQTREVEAEVPAIATVDLGVRDLQARLEVVQSQFGGVVAALSESTARLQAAVALIADLPTREAATDSGRELRQRLEQMLVAQQRTNELLDLALGVAVAPDVARRP